MNEFEKINYGNMNNDNEIEDNKTKNSEQEKKEIYKSIAPFLNIGLQMALTIVVFVLLGWWLDGKFDKSPLFTLIFSLVGIFAAFYNFFKVVTKIKE
jgi:F0F1-type ATP synthase assembly protein I